MKIAQEKLGLDTVTRPTQQTVCPLFGSVWNLKKELILFRNSGYNFSLVLTHIFAEGEG
jgi:hypothetical protein